jgi:hypothetical protein
MKYKIILFFLLLLFYSNCNAFWIIGNTSIDKKEFVKTNELLLIFSLKKTHWNDGQPIIITTFPFNNAIYQDFSSEVLGINHNILKNIWDIKVYSGNISPPNTVKTRKEMIEYIKEYNGSVGYVYSNSIPGVYTLDLQTIPPKKQEE